VVSEHSRDYLRYVFPQLRLFRIHYGIDKALFNFSADKKKQIAFMPRRLPQDIIQVINILKFRGALGDFELVPIDNKTEQEVAVILRESLIFLSFSDREGYGLPPQEALACGCIVIGYHGSGGKEFFDEAFCYPVDATDTIAFSRTVEKVIGECSENGASLREKAQLGAEFVLRTYSSEHEEADIINCWKTICALDEQPVGLATSAL
jgi:glycosyltransferase involved in cell wall biosynthesis